MLEKGSMKTLFKDLKSTCSRYLGCTRQVSQSYATFVDPSFLLKVILNPTFQTRHRINIS